MIIQGKSRCHGTMTESQYLAFIRSALRSRWLRWIPRSKALEAAKKPYKGENKRQKFEYECAICMGRFSQKDVEVDHFPREAGSILNVQDIGEFCNNLFCEVDNLRVVCKYCHSIHTYASKNHMSFSDARTIKEAIKFIDSSSKQELLDYLQQFGYHGSSVSNADKRRELVIKLFKEESCKTKISR